MQIKMHRMPQQLSFRNTTGSVHANRTLIRCQYGTVIGMFCGAFAVHSGAAPVLIVSCRFRNSIPEQGNFCQSTDRIGQGMPSSRTASRTTEPLDEISLSIGA
ncbi:hypothetical protein EVAR_14791_1 [Eumeta japonica]|uniref:Uncharacterized protein n=1 Tax=Eumeta variegata TaxID=151549 RepID=A0A4C1TWU2_EUMVA|nr:hypothetical protein EVAR_14791_1 [Eumeta japonica]